jgi:hypothetical protein
MAVDRGRLPGLLGEPRQHLGSAASAGELLRSLVLTRLVEVDDHDAATAHRDPDIRRQGVPPVGDRLRIAGMGPKPMPIWSSRRSADLGQLMFEAGLVHTPIGGRRAFRRRARLGE